MARPGARPSSSHRLVAVAVVVAACTPALFADEGAHGIAIVAAPARPFIERRGAEQRLNFDLLVDNGGPSALRLVAVRLTVLDDAGRALIVREVNENGHPPAIELVGRRTLPPGETLDVFNPFYSFDGDVPLRRLRYELSFMRGDRRPGVPLAFAADVIRSLDVLPTEYAGKTDLILPLGGRVLVQDGHDFYSHHRRRAQTLDGKKRGGPRPVPANFYAYDLMIVGSDGIPFHGDPFRPEHWLSYGAEVDAPADGVVVEVANDVGENRFDGGRVVQASAPQDPDGMGNHVIIDHGNGEFSVLLHFMAGSVRVRRGDHVAQGQPLGQIGFSGDALVPHLHYFVSSSGHAPLQGVPSYFCRFRRLLGERSVAVDRGQIDSGDIVERAGRPRGGRD